MSNRIVRAFSKALFDASKALYDFWKQFPEMDIVAFIATLAGLSNCEGREVHLEYSPTFSDNTGSFTYYGCITWVLTVPILMGIRWEQKIVRLYIPYLSDLEKGIQCFFVLENGDIKEALTYLSEISGVFKKRLSLNEIPEN